MPQNPIPAAIAQLPSKAFAPMKLNANGDLLNASDPTGYSTAQVSAASLIKNAPGALMSVNNLNVTNLAYLSTTSLAALTSTAIGAFYDINTTQMGALTTTQTAALTSITSVVALTTTQVAALASTQLIALTPQTTSQFRYDTPFANGLVFVPGTNQSVKVVLE